MLGVAAAAVAYSYSLQCMDMDMEVWKTKLMLMLAFLHGWWPLTFLLVVLCCLFVSTYYYSYSVESSIWQHSYRIVYTDTVRHKLTVHDYSTSSFGSLVKAHITGNIASNNATLRLQRYCCWCQ